MSENFLPHLPHFSLPNIKRQPRIKLGRVGFEKGTKSFCSEVSYLGDPCGSCKGTLFQKKKLNQKGTQGSYIKALEICNSTVVFCVWFHYIWTQKIIFRLKVGVLSQALDICNATVVFDLFNFDEGQKVIFRLKVGVLSPKRLK